MQIGHKEVGKDGRVFIIAEVGSNWKDMKDCIYAIERAAECGADAVKFQLFDFQSLYGLSDAAMPSYYKSGSGKHELQIEWLSNLKHACDNNSIELMISAFSVDFVHQVDRYVGVHKVASSEITNKPLLEAIQSTGKPVMISTGGASVCDIDLAMSMFDGSRVILNYCVGAYPAIGTNLFKIDALAKYGVPVGFSDHSLDYIYLPLAAVKHHGAIAVEKHFSCIGTQTPDTPHSLNIAQFKIMVDFLRGRKTTVIGPSIEEHDMLTKTKRRIVATIDIKKGDDFNYGANCGAFRSLRPATDILSPFSEQVLTSRQAARDIKAGECIGYSDLHI